MDLRQQAQQYRGTTLPKLVEKQIKSLSEDTLLQAIRGTYDNFPSEQRPHLDAFTQSYLENWFGPHVLTTDLGELFSIAVSDIRDMAADASITLDDERVFDVFNMMVMKVAHFAHSRPEFRKQLGIKKGWFS